jgi:hypothetical protein
MFQAAQNSSFYLLQTVSKLQDSTLHIITLLSILLSVLGALYLAYDILDNPDGILRHLLRVTIPMLAALLITTPLTVMAFSFRQNFAQLNIFGGATFIVPILVPVFAAFIGLLHGVFSNLPDASNSVGPVDRKGKQPDGEITPKISLRSWGKQHAWSRSGMLRGLLTGFLLGFIYTFVISLCGILSDSLNNSIFDLRVDLLTCVIIAGIVGLISALVGLVLWGRFSSKWSKKDVLRGLSIGFLMGFIFAFVIGILFIFNDALTDPLFDIRVDLLTNVLVAGIIGLIGALIGLLVYGRLSPKWSRSGMLHGFISGFLLGFISTLLIGLFFILINFLNYDYFDIRVQLMISVAWAGIIGLSGALIGLVLCGRVSSKWSRQAMLQGFSIAFLFGFIYSFVIGLTVVLNDIFFNPCSNSNLRLELLHDVLAAGIYTLPVRSDGQLLCQKGLPD